MARFLTPRSLARRADIYQQLSQLLSAGMPIIQALDLQQRTVTTRAFWPFFTRLIEALHQGRTVTEALERVPEWVPEFDRALLEAGEMSGRLPQSLRFLAEDYRERSVLLRQALSDMAYPLFLFHFAVLLAPFPALVLSGNVGVYMTAVLATFVPVYALLGMLYWAFQPRRGESWRAALENIVAAVPVVGPMRQAFALARLSAALEALIRAGAPILGAWQIAADASGSIALRREVERWRPQIEQGDSPGDLMSQGRVFPEVFCSLYQTGEVSGTLDETLERLHELYLDQARQRLRMLAQWVPRVLYFAVAALVAYQVIRFYAAHFAGINQLIEL